MTTLCGYRVHETTLRDAPFVCPRCGLDREGREIEPQRWWTLFGVRLVPLAAHERVIESATCGHRCDTGAFEIPTTAMLAIYLDEATRAAAASVAAACSAVADDLDPAVVAAAVAAVRDVDQHYDESRLRSDIDTLEPAQTRTRLGRLRAELTSHGKQGLLRRMSNIATATGPMGDDERRSVVEVGLALGMAAPHVNGILAVADLQHQAA